MSEPCPTATRTMATRRHRCPDCSHVMAVHGIDGICDVCDVETAIDAVASQLNDLA